MENTATFGKACPHRANRPDRAVRLVRQPPDAERSSLEGARRAPYPR
jgi:hypothetical protein